MKISTRGRYALRVMLDLAEHTGDGYITLMDIAQRLGISEKYLESIIVVLSRERYVLALRGKGGGYRLARRPEEYTAGSILKLTEGSLAPVVCLEGDGGCCTNNEGCKTLPLWQELDRLIDNYLESVTLADLLNNGK